MKNYFRLKPECYLIVGNKRSIIHNLLTEEALWIDEINTKKLLKSELNNTVDMNDKLYKELLDMGWGIKANKPIFVDKLRTINSFSRKKLWLDTQNISFATLHVVNSCNLDCDFCNENFCPSCKKFKDSEYKEGLSIIKWKEIIDELIIFGLKTVFITGGETTLYKDLNDLVKYCLNKNLNTNVHTNGLRKFNNINKKVKVIISLFNFNDLHLVIKNNLELDDVTLIVQEKYFNIVKLRLEKENINWKIVKIFDFKYGVKLTKKNLEKVNINKFTEKKLGNYCLKEKIFISYCGDIYSCCGSNDKILNLNENKLSKAIKILIENYWNKPIEKNEKMSKCLQCEFRFLCKVCIFMDVDKYCNYSLEEGKWKY